MPDVDPQKVLRDQLLDDLKKAKDELVAKEMKRIAAEEAYLRGLKSRGGAAALARANATASKLLLIQDIGTFLTG